MKRTPIRRVSKKRSAELRLYSKLRRQYLEDHPSCAWWLAENGLTEGDVDMAGCVIIRNEKGIRYNCVVPLSTEVHHKNKRHGDRLNDVSQWMAVSREGHEWIENNKSEARKRGYLNNI